MFERRLKLILAGFGVVLMILVARLIDIQVVHANDYRVVAERVLLRPAKILPFVRGRILDRHGRVLASDEPCWQVCVDFDVLSGDAEEDGADTGRLDGLRRELAAFSGETVQSLREREVGIVERIGRWRAKAADARGYDLPIREERMPHAIVRDLDDQRQIAARQRFAAYPWVTVEHGSRRVYDADESVGHILGRLGAVDIEALRNDPEPADSPASLLPSDEVGISGVEYSAERELRGRRGRTQLNRRGEIIEDTAAVNGRDVSLTLHYELQKRLYDLMGEQLPAVAPESTGGSIVVLDVTSREVLAMVSYPGFDANTFSKRYDELRLDTKRTPLRFRAVANGYEPGSIVKPLTCVAGIGSGVIDTNTTFHCDGYYDRELFPNSYRCWTMRGTDQRKQHGGVATTAAIAGSCNVFMYHVGDLLGPERLCNYFDMAGIGKTTGIGLREERYGINPTPSWLMENKGQTATRGSARNYAIGQGEVVVTPIQAANLMATYATGVAKELTLVRDAAESRSWRLPVDARAWAAVREGLFRVTNDPDGTAYHQAHWVNSQYALCGKTGSATTEPSPTHYRVAYKDEIGASRFAIIPAKVYAHAVEEFKKRYPTAQFDPEKDVTVAQVWPPSKSGASGEKHSHAWFAGYLQRISADGGLIANQTPRIAFALMIEFGGSGGYTAGPVAKQIAQMIHDTLGPNLDPNSLPGGPGA